MDSVFFNVNNSPGTSDTFRTALRESTGPVATDGVWGIEWVVVVVVVLCGGLNEWVSG